MFKCCAFNNYIVMLIIYIFEMCVHRYLKNIFPKVDETILLDILEQSDNNVQKASEKLINLGYEKRNPTLPAKALAKKKEKEQVMSVIHSFAYKKREFQIFFLFFLQAQNQQVAPTPPPRIKSLEEKNKSTYILRSTFLYFCIFFFFLSILTERKIL